MASTEIRISPLLTLLGKYTVLDYDNNDATLCEVYPNGTFTDMTSNQAIVAGELSKPHHKHLMVEAVKEASQLALDGFQGVKGRDVASVAVDIVTIKLGLTILPLLKRTGLVNFQLSLAASISLDKLLAHGRSAVALYDHYGIPRSRVCLKIPSTLEGIQACGRLEEEGINTLATMCFSVEQALAAAQAKARYVAVYVNPLKVHFVPGTHQEMGLHGLPGYEVLRVAQKTLKQRGWDGKTKMMAASIVTLSEALSLAGLDHWTLSPTVLALLTSTPLTPEIEASITQSLSLYAEAQPTSIGCDLKTEEGRKTLVDALMRDDVKELMRSATEIFGDFETQLYEVAKQKLNAVTEGH
ncbi:BQ2448_5517 [Microbotryum intermedium]|uniref:BQ2448_5517 protein n=1 Tax=Microbotryum intermedium TaxID=269621 RepID=A0A238F9Y9_9BASI|nr:BQ2448_5517 [Microbotryum intermedium]